MINVVYMVVRIIQFSLFLATFWLIYRIYQTKNTRKQRILLVASICAALNMYGYLEAMTTMSEQSSKWAVRSQYVSALLYLVFMLHLIELLCDFSVGKIQAYILWTLNVVFAILICVDEGLQILFRNYTFEENLLALQIHFDCTPLGYVYMAYVICLVAAILYVGTVIRQSKGKDAIVTVLAVFTVLPCLGYVLNLAGLTGGYDAQSALMVLACWIAYRANGNYHILDDGQIARETILDEMAEGYIILDNERNVKAYNAIAAMLYPELEKPKEREVIIELIYLHNHDVIEHNGKICNVVVSELKENGDLTGYVMWLYDCTDEYYYMKDLEQVKKRAKDLDKTRNLFLNHMTHGFGSPLHIIKDRADAIYEDERSSEDVREMTLEIFEAGQKLQDMVAVMMDYSGSEDAVRLKETEYSTEQLVRLLSGMLEARRQGRCRQAEFVASPQIPQRWYGSLDGIEQALSAVFRCIGIASKVSQMRMEVTSETRYADTLLITTLYLEDNGATTGEFNRLEAMRHKDAESLEEKVDYIPYAYCTKVLAEMKGTMYCSVDGTQSKISLMFPERVVDNTPFGVRQGAADEAQGQTGDEAAKKVHTVMVVDDNLIYLKEMDNWLRKMGLKTIMAKSGAECLRILERKSVDMIFMDQMMPEMEGTEAFEKVRELELKKQTAPVPVILLTADDAAGARKKYLEYGFDNYLSKPIEEQQICAEVRKYLSV